MCCNAVRVREKVKDCGTTTGHVGPVGDRAKAGARIGSANMTEGSVYSASMESDTSEASSVLHNWLLI
jgi:hypothetical protein